MNSIQTTKQNSLKIGTILSKTSSTSSNPTRKEFPELNVELPLTDDTRIAERFPWIPKTKSAVVLEIGCGVGNTLFPLMELNPSKYFIGFDCAPHAISNFQVSLLEISN